MLRLSLIIVGFFLALIGLGGILILESGNSTFQMSAKLKSQSLQGDRNQADRYQQLLKQAMERANLYEHEIQENHLYMGMIVNRDSSGGVRGECDSLLFSSLRFVALNKLGFEDKAADAWKHITRAEDRGRWYRHPKCRRRSTSRDMIVGVLAALSQQPEGGEHYLRNLLHYIDESGGYIGSGPFHVSRLSPGLAQTLRLLADNYKIERDILPPQVLFGYSTLELNAISVPKGYRSHLVAMNAWLELELQSRNHSFDSSFRSPTELLDHLMLPVSPHSFHEQRLKWVSGMLVDLDSENLFFQWLQLKAAGALNTKTKADLLEKLIGMEQFPESGLPQNCTRKADYLWQRDSKEYKSQQSICNKTFSGVDFLWMLSLLV